MGVGNGGRGTGLVTDLALECYGQVSTSHEAGLDTGHLGQLGLEVPDGRHAERGHMATSNIQSCLHAARWYPEFCGRPPMSASRHGDPAQPPDRGIIGQLTAR